MIPVVGVTNNAGKNHFLFFMEHDKVDLFDVLEEASFVSQCSEIDVDVLETSHDDITGLSNYHLVSYDVLTRSEVDYAQRLCFETGHYPEMDELQLSIIQTKFCRLRVGEKGKKGKPFFVARFECPTNKHFKSRSHVWIYSLYCRIPQPKGIMKKVISQSQILCIYYLKKKHEDRILNKVLRIFKSDNRHNRKEPFIKKKDRKPKSETLI
jgi:hypothetical protein